MEEARGGVPEDRALMPRFQPMDKATIDYHLRQIIQHSKDARIGLTLGEGASISVHLRRIREQLDVLDQLQLEATWVARTPSTSQA